MKNGVNRVTVLGRLGADPEMRNMPNGNAVTNLSLATSESWTDKQTGQPQERTEWHRVSAFGKLAEIMGQYLRKGSQIYIEGQLRTRKWQDDNGNDRYTTEIIADQMQMLGTKQSDQANLPNPQPSQPKPSANYAKKDTAQGDDFTDDIPF